MPTAASPVSQSTRRLRNDWRLPLAGLRIAVETSFHLIRLAPPWLPLASHNNGS